MRFKNNPETSSGLKVYRNDKEKQKAEIPKQVRNDKNGDSSLQNTLPRTTAFSSSRRVVEIRSVVRGD